MDYDDAFTEEAITAAGTNAVGEEEEYLRQLVARIYATNELPMPSNDAINVALLFWVAGRTYERDMEPEEAGRLAVSLTPKAASVLINMGLEAMAEGEA